VSIKNNRERSRWIKAYLLISRHMSVRASKRIRRAPPRYSPEVVNLVDDLSHDEEDDGEASIHSDDDFAMTKSDEEFVVDDNLIEYIEDEPVEIITELSDRETSEDEWKESDDESITLAIGDAAKPRIEEKMAAESKRNESEGGTTADV